MVSGACVGTATAPPASADYSVYAKWTSAGDRATEATYIIHHAGGTSSVTVNQRHRPGEWVLLGSYHMDLGAGHRVELSDAGSGTLVADAVYVAPTPRAPPESFV